MQETNDKGCAVTHEMRVSLLSGFGSMGAFDLTALALINRDDILQQLRDGKLLKEVAQSYGVSKQAIQQPLKDDPEYRAALLEQAESLIDETKEATWNAREALDIARAREMSKWAFRYAEAVNPARWSSKPDTSSTFGQAGITINIGTVQPGITVEQDGGGVVKEIE
jgi:hypothetical protein